MTSFEDRLALVDAPAGGDGGAGGAPAPAPAPPAAPPAPAGDDKPFYEAFTKEDLKTHPTIQRFKTPETLAEAYLAAEKRLGVPLERHLVIPADPNDKDGMAAVWNKLGRPEKPDGYGLALDDKATAADKAFLGRGVEAMHALGLSAEQAKGVFALWQKEGETVNAAAAQAVTARRAEATAALKQEWGQAYDQRGKEIGALLNRLGAPNVAKAMDGDAMFDHPELAMMLGKVLDAMAEPGAAAGDPLSVAPGGALTPAQAKAKAREIEASPALRDAKHPQHKAAVEERNKYLAMAEARPS